LNFEVNVFVNIFKTFLNYVFIFPSDFRRTRAVDGGINLRDEKSAERRQTRTEDDADQDSRKSQESADKTSPGRNLYRALDDKIQV
jgi:hypothetical protein